jgi:hypothetical protein
MPPEPKNTDTQLIIHRLNELQNGQVNLIKEIREHNKIADQERKKLEIDQAVLAKSYEQVCQDINELKSYIKRNDLVSSIISAIGSYLASVATIIGIK